MSENSDLIQPTDEWAAITITWLRDLKQQRASYPTDSAGAAHVSKQMHETQRVLDEGLRDLQSQPSTAARDRSIQLFMLVLSEIPTAAGGNLKMQ